MNRLFQLGLLVVLQGVIASHAMAKEAAEVLAIKLNNIQTLSAKFSQSTYNTQGQLVQTSEGRMVLKRPGQFYWRATFPMVQEIIADGKRIWVYDIDLEQVTVQQQNNDELRPAMILTGDANTLSEHYSIEQVKQVEPGDWFILTPKTDEAHFTWLQLYFERAKLKKILFEDALGSRTLIEFKSAKFNQPVDLKLFKFTLPPNVDVVQN